MNILSLTFLTVWRLLSNNVVHKEIKIIMTLILIIVLFIRNGRETTYKIKQVTYVQEKNKDQELYLKLF